MKIQSFTFNPFQENTYVVYDDTKECIIIDPSKSLASLNMMIEPTNIIMNITANFSKKALILGSNIGEIEFHPSRPGMGIRLKIIMAI